MILKRILINFKQRPLNLILRILLTISTLIFVIISVLMYSSTLEVLDGTYKQLGSIINVQPTVNFENAVPHKKETIDEILALDDVLGLEKMNYTSLVDIFPINFNNSQKYTGQNPYEQNVDSYFSSGNEIYSKSLNIIGCDSVHLYDYFRRGISSLIEGDFPNDSNQGIIISDLLAEENSLNVGDVIEFNVIQNNFETNEIIINDELVSLEIVGIYKTDLYFEITSNNNLGSSVIKNSPYNTMFAPFSTISFLNGFEDEAVSFDIYVSSPDKISNVMLDLQNVSINYDMYTLTDVTKTYYNDITSGVEQLAGSMKNLVLMSCITSLCLFFIVLFTLSYDNEISILRVLGEKKQSIILQKLIEFTMILSLSTPIALFVGLRLSKALEPFFTVENTLPSIVSVPFNNGGINYIPEILVGYSINNMLFIVFYLLLMLILISVYTTLTVKKHNLKEIFNEK